MNVRKVREPSPIMSHNTCSRRTHRHHPIRYTQRASRNACPFGAGGLRPIRYIQRASRLSVFLAFCGILLILFLFWQILSEQKEAQKPVRITASLPSGSIKKELLSDIQDFPGLLHCWAVYSVQAEIKIGSYQTSAEIMGVDLSAWSFKITKSAGPKRRGTAPLLVAGEDFFQTLTDEYGTEITKRQVQVFQEKIETLDVEITLFSNPSDSTFSTVGASPPAGDTLQPSQNPSSLSTAEDTLSMGSTPSLSANETSFLNKGTSSSASGNAFSAQGASFTFTGSFLALAEGDKLYMDAGQMKEMLEGSYVSTGISHICVELKGKQNAENAKKGLIKAGFLVE